MAGVAGPEGCTFGPVPSRRLGRSLGINNIPAKTCTYSCVYCQLGRTPRMLARRQPFYDPGRIAREVEKRLAAATAAGEQVDFLAFVPDGEPTLDANLGRTIDLLKPLGVPVAVITNGSLLARDDVREDLSRADWVSLKVDAVDETLWRRVDRPHGGLALPDVLAGALAFAERYEGELVSETMLVGGLNDGERCVAGTAAFLARLQPSCAYLSVPTRPPAEPWVRCPDEGTVTRAYEQVAGVVARVELLTGYEGDAFAFTGDAEQDLLSITAVHPMREEAVAAFLERAGAPWAVVDGLLARGDLAATRYAGHTYYVRAFGRGGPRRA